MKKIMFTGGGGAGTEAIWRVLSDRYELYFADADPDAIPGLVPASRRVRIPFAGDANFLAALEAVCQQHRIDVLVPGVDEELVPIRANQPGFSLPTLLAPSLDFIRLMLDKLRCCNAIAAAGLSAPRTLPVDRIDEMSYPLIVKPVSGRGSRGVSVLHSRDELLAYKLLNKSQDSSLIAQELRGGTEYTVQVSVDASGRLNAIIPVRVVQKKGITIRAETERNEAIIAYIQAFHQAFPTTGIYNVQCMLDAAGGIYPFEVNPRISTTFCMALALGFDPFSDDTQTLFVPETNIRLKRSWVNQFSTCDA